MGAASHRSPFLSRRYAIIAVRMVNAIRGRIVTGHVFSLAFIADSFVCSKAVISSASAVDVIFRCPMHCSGSCPHWEQVAVQRAMAMSRHLSSVAGDAVNELAPSFYKAYLLLASFTRYFICPLSRPSYLTSSTHPSLVPVSRSPLCGCSFHGRVSHGWHHCSDFKR